MFWKEMLVNHLVHLGLNFGRELDYWRLLSFEVEFDVLPLFHWTFKDFIFKPQACGVEYGSRWRVVSEKTIYC